MAFDMSLVQRGARNRRTPYYEATQRYDPKGYTVYNHMYFPIRFDTFENEFDALLNRVTLWDVSVERCLEISGPDGFRFAQLLTPRDLSKCVVGQGKYVLICDSDGGIVNDPVMTRMDETTFWFALASSDALLFARGLKNAYPDLDVTIREADVAPLQVQGPRSKDVMVKLLGQEILELRYYFWTKGEIAGAPVVVTRTGWTSEVGYEVYLTDNNALEMGLERLVDWDLPEDAAISLRALRQIRDRGVSKKIVGLELDGDPFDGLNNTKWPVSSGGRLVGKVTSAIWSPRLGRNIGYAWVPVDLSGLGTELVVETEWGSRSAVVVEMPFVDPAKQIPVS
jgi:aminomethyltransferase